MCVCKGVEVLGQGGCVAVMEGWDGMGWEEDEVMEWMGVLGYGGWW